MLSRILLGALRIWLGWQWLQSGWSKVNSPSWTGKNAGVAVSGFLNGALAKTGGEHPEVHAWYGWFIREIALPNAKLFSYLVAYGEVIVGIALILGFFTLFAALGSIFMNLNYLYAGTTSSNPEMLIAGIFIALFFLSAGYYGIDYFINPYIVDLYNRVFHKDKKYHPR